jgi:hypothetical protein
MPIIRGSPPYSYLIEFDSINGPESYKTGGFTVKTKLSKVYKAFATIDGGLKAEVVQEKDESFKVKVYRYDYPGNTAGPAVEIPSKTDLSGRTIRYFAFGE